MDDSLVQSIFVLFEAPGSSSLAAALRKVFYQAPVLVYDLATLPEQGAKQPVNALLLVVASSEKDLDEVSETLECLPHRALVFVKPALLERACERFRSSRAGIWPLLELEANIRLLERLSQSPIEGPDHHETLNSISEAVVETDVHGMIVAANHAAQELLGLDAEALKGTSIESLRAGHEPLLSAQAVGRLLRTGRFDSELSLYGPDRKPFPAHVAVAMVRALDGQPQRLVLTCRDISVRLAALRQSREAQRRLAFHVERTPLAFVEFNLEGQIVGWNSAAERTFGWTAAEVYRRHYSTLVPEHFRDEYAQIFALMCKQEGGEQSTNENLTKEGRTIICEWHNTALLDDQGEVIGFASLVSDITDRVRFEEEIRASRALAEEANRSKDDFLSLMNHEMRTPLNSIIGFTDLLRDCVDPDERDSTLETIQQNAQQLLKLVDQVLAYTRLDSGRVFLAMRETDLEILLHEVSESIVMKADEKGLGFELDVEHDLPMAVFADHDELRNLLLRLLDNAVKFTNEGHIALRVSSRPVSGSRRNRCYRFEVVDTGPGVPEVARDQIFDSFRQADSSLRRSYSGSGLGLALCRKIVDLMDGSIWHECNPAGGSVFICEVPLSVVDTSRRSKSPFEEDANVSLSRFFAEYFPADLLLVTANRETSACAKMLDMMGYRPEIVPGLSEMLECLARHRFQMILVDLQAPGPVLQRARELARKEGGVGRAGPLVVLVAHSTAISRAPFQRELFDGILEKPVRQAPLQKLLRRASSLSTPTGSLS